MPWTLKFWSSSPPPPATPVTWNYSINDPPADVSAQQAADIAGYLNSIAAQSTTASSRLNAYGQDIRFGYKSGEVGKAVRGGSVDDYVLIDLSAAADLYFFNTLGKLVAADIRLTIMHELAHILVIQIADFANGDFGINVGDPIEESDFVWEYDAEASSWTYQTSLPFGAMANTGVVWDLVSAGIHVCRIH